MKEVDERKSKKQHIANGNQSLLMNGDVQGKKKLTEWVSSFNGFFISATGDLTIVFLMAGAMGLEPTTYAVTGRHCNQLNYAPAL